MAWISFREPVGVGDARAAGVWRPWVLTSIYVVFAGLWIVVSDRIVTLTVEDRTLAGLLASAKGIAFVAATAALLLRMLGRMDRASRANAAAAAALEHEVRAMQAMFANIAESSSDAIYAKDRDGRYLLMNRAAEAMLNLAPGEGIGKTDDALFPPEQASRLQRTAREIRDAGRVVTLEEQVIIRDEPRDWLTTAGPLRDAQGEVIGTFGLSRDVTERQRTAARLALAATSFEMASFGIAITDARTNRLLDVNPAFAAARGRRRGDMPGTPILDLFPPQLRAAACAAIAEVDARGHVVIETEHVRADGSSLPVRLDSTIVRDATGRAMHRITYATDLTKRKRAEAAVAASERRYRNLFQNAPDAVFICDDDRIVMANSAALDLLSPLTLDRVIGRSLLELAPGSHLPGLADRRARLRSGDDADRGPVGGVIHLNARDIVVEFVAAPFVDDGRELLHLIVRDVSVRSALESQIIDISTAEQARIGREIHDGVCQELVASGLMIGAVQTQLSRLGVSEDLRTSMRELQALNQQALMEARAIANGSAPIHVDATTLEGALRAMMSSVSAVYAPTCRMSFSTADLDLDAVTATHVYRIAQEALANAIKHARATVIEVELKASGRCFDLRLSDDGRGFPDEPAAWGHLGISIMRHRAHLVGASLSIRPRPGGGSEVRCIRANRE